MNTNWIRVLSGSCLGLCIIASAACSDDDGSFDDGGFDADVDGGGDASSSDGGGTFAWEQLGDQVSPATAESEDPVMLAIDGQPAVGYRHAGFRVYLHLWDGTTWSATAVDPTGANTDASIHRAPDMCSAGDAIYMAYVASGDGGASGAAFYDRVFVYRWKSLTDWEIQNGGNEVSEPWDPVSEVGYDADEAAIGCRAAGAPAVAWAEVDAVVEGEVDVFASLLTGGGRSPRIDRDTVGVAGTGTRTTEVAVAADDTIYVAHFEDTGSTTDLSTQLFVTRHSGSTLQNLGAAIDIDFDSNTLAPPSLAVDGDQLYLAWAADRDDSGTRQVYVANWSGTAWELLGGGPLSALGAARFDANSPDLLMRDGVLTITWTESDQDGQYIFVAEYRGGSWEVIGDRINVDTDHDALDPSLADVEGTLHVAFEEMVDGWPQIFVKRRVLH